MSAADIVVPVRPQALKVEKRPSKQIIACRLMLEHPRETMDVLALTAVVIAR